MKTNLIAWCALAAVAVISLAACNSSGLSTKPRATFSKLACLDVNGDGRINTKDAADPEELPDFNADDEHDEYDAAFVEGVDIPLAPAAAQACAEGVKKPPEYLVAHDFFTKADVNCGPGDRGVLMLGVAGGVGNLKDHDDAAGVRAIVDELIERYEGEEHQTIAVVTGSALTDAENAHTGMEDWLTNAVRVYLDRFPCLDTVLVGFSHGGVTVQAVAARIEQEYADRIIATVVLDRIEDYYQGDLTARPATSPLINIYQHNEGEFGGKEYVAPNVLNWDASGEKGPRDGQNGGPLEPVRHTTIDNSKTVREWIANVVLGR